jgi:hypothetical protein
MSNQRNVKVTMNYTIYWVLFLIFLVLKLTHLITWSWLWVTAPLWGAFAVTLVVVGIVALLVALRKVRRK